jgi:Mg-chelatase subunit ChlD
MNTINSISIQFANPWLLLLLIPVIIFPLVLFFRLKKRHRNNRYRITSLVLRILALVAGVLVLSGMDIESRTLTKRNDVIILVDTSDSTSSSLDRMNAQIESIIEESGGEYNIGIISFANGNIYNVQMTSNTSQVLNRYLNTNSKPDASGTNIGVALSYARSQLDNPNEGRIILLTDGLETDDSALNTVRDIADSGVRIDTIYFNPNSHFYEFQVNAVSVPERVNVGEGVELSVDVQSTVAGTGILSVYDNSTLIYQEAIEMNGYEETFTIDYMFNSGGLHELYFDIQGEFDTVQENNKYYAYVNIDASSNILIVEGKDGEANLMVDLLGSDNAVTVVGVDNLPESTTALQIYDEVILMNVQNSQLPDLFVQLLDVYVNQLGGGLLTIGGDQAYVEDDMSGSDLEAMLPVVSTTSARPIAVMYVLDSSGSMNDLIGSTGKTRFELAKDGAIASVNQLADRDYFGLVSFNSVANVAIPLTPASRREEIIEDIDALQTVRGTMYKDGLELAASALKTMSDVYIKHIIFITDGTATDSRDGYTAVVEGLADDNITLSGIAIYRSDFLTSGVVEDLADIGGGRYYYIQDATELPDIMVTESTTSAIEYVNEGVFSPTIANFTPAVTGITELPELGGYYGTLLKEDATMVLRTNEELPLYASWQYGSGRVGSFTSDLNGSWSANYFADPEGQKLIRNIVSSLFPEKSMEEKTTNAEFLNSNYSSTVKITSQIDDGETITAEVTDPTGTTTDIRLNQISEGVFSGDFNTRRAGIYTVSISKENSSGTVLSETFEYTSFSYSEEYDVFLDSNTGFQLVDEISNLGNGKVLYTTDGAFSEQAQVMINSFDPRYLFLSLMMLFFILDIFARKFKFKWPHELIRDYRAKQASA